MFLTHEEFLKKVELSGSKYWEEGKNYRWEYMSYVIELMKSIGAEKVIETGSYGMPLKSDSFLFTYPEYDLNKTPFDFEDKAFDCFVALQVWEHLEKQQEAFREVMRISKNAILSFPYRWNYGDAQHRGIDEGVIANWTLGVKPVLVKRIKNRIVYRWKFQ